MEPWKEVCIYMCVYAFIREFRPIDPFFIKYLTLLSEKYTVELIKEEVYPVGSYANVFFVVIIFLVTDYLRYKPIIILNGLSGVISYGLLLGSPSIMALKTGQVFQMLFRAAEVAYVSYTFAKIKNKDQYQIASSWVRTSVMVGKFSCGMLSQVLISWNLVSYIHLLYLSIFGTILTTIWSLIIPSVKCSMYFYKEKESVVNTIVVHNQEIVNTVVIKEDLNKNRIKDDYIKMKFGEVLQKLWTDFKVAYADANVFKWSAWYSLSLCGYVLVAQYIQLQWQEIASHKKNTLLMNGAVESTATLFSAVTAYIIGIIQIDWGKHGELIMATVALGLGIILSFLAYTEYLAISYVCYVFFCCTYQTMLTLSSAEVAKFLQRDCYALVFGFNKFIASIFITVFTLFVVEDTFFSFNIREQFLIYGMYFVCLGFIFLLLAFMSLKRSQKNDTLS